MATFLVSKWVETSLFRVNVLVGWQRARRAGENLRFLVQLCVVGGVTTDRPPVLDHL